MSIVLISKVGKWLLSFLNSFMSKHAHPTTPVCTCGDAHGPHAEIEINN